MPHRVSIPLLARLLAEAFLACDWEDDAIQQCASHLLGRRWRWLPPLVDRILKAYPDRNALRFERLRSFLVVDPGLLQAWHKHRITFRFDCLPTPAMRPAAGPPQSWPLPPLTTPRELAAFLELEVGDLNWLADIQGRSRRMADGPLTHYRYQWRVKRSGEARLVEAPKPRLRAIQRTILDAILTHIPPHDAAHGFRKGRSIGSFVSPHTERVVVLKMDLRDFFPTITAGRVLSVFLTAGYPEPVARLLVGLCTNRAPNVVWLRPEVASRSGKPELWRRQRLHAEPHLPQGAPTSPALANLIAYRLDARLTGLAQAAGACYTRYADDLVFSGEDSFARGVDRFRILAAAIALEEGFHVHHHKTRVMRRGTRQLVAGVVLNEKPNIPRVDYDRLKAILCNCVRLGPSSQNREGMTDFRAHLAGRIAHVSTLNPARAEKLRLLFNQIDW
jgi:hypothetical protein